MSEMELSDIGHGRPLGAPPGGVGTVLGWGLACVGALAAGFGLPLISNGEVEVGCPVFSCGMVLLLAAVPVSLAATALPRVFGIGVLALAVRVAVQGMWWLTGLLFPFGVAFLFMDGSHPVDWRVQARWVLIWHPSPSCGAGVDGGAWVTPRRGRLHAAAIDGRGLPPGLGGAIGGSRGDRDGTEAGVRGVVFPRSEPGSEACDGEP